MSDRWSVEAATSVSVPFLRSVKCRVMHIMSALEQRVFVRPPLSDVRPYVDKINVLAKAPNALRDF
jgi:hypothetical protein